jgi:hypothetical protein
MIWRGFLTVYKLLCNNTVDTVARLVNCFGQGCGYGSGSVSGSVSGSDDFLDPDPDWESGSRIRIQGQ